MKKALRIGSILFGGVLWLCAPILAAELYNRVVAFVNNDIITFHELNKKIEGLTGSSSEEIRQKNEEKYLSIRQDVLDYLIEEKLTEFKIRELGIVVSSNQVDAAIERIKKDSGWTQEDLFFELKKQGISFEKYKENIKKEIELAHLIELEVRSKILIKEEKIRQYYQEHGDEYKSDDRVHLSAIFLVRKDAETEESALQLKETIEEIQKKILKGVDFNELAKMYSNGPGAESGGELGVFKTKQLDPELQRLLEGMTEGEVSGPLVRPDGIQLVKLMQREKGAVKSFETVRNSIYDMLYREEVKNRYISWIKELKENSYIKIIF